jgi:hypothetical protein
MTGFDLNSSVQPTGYEPAQQDPQGHEDDPTVQGVQVPSCQFDQIGCAIDVPGSHQIFKEDEDPIHATRGTQPIARQEKGAEKHQAQQPTC